MKVTLINKKVILKNSKQLVDTQEIQIEHKLLVIKVKVRIPTV